MVSHVANVTRVMVENYVRLKLVQRAAKQLEVPVILVLESVQIAHKSVTENMHANMYIAVTVEAITLPTCVTTMVNATTVLVYVPVS
jgi:hypothetical protein